MDGLGVIHIKHFQSWIVMITAVFASGLLALILSLNRVRSSTLVVLLKKE